MNRLSQYLTAQGATEAASQRADGVWFSEPEIRLAEALTQRGLPFEQQVRVIDEGRTRFILDFLVAGVLGVEIDGREFHHDGKDARRDEFMFRKHDVWTLRVAGWRVMRDADAIVSLVALKLSEFRWRPVTAETK